MELDVYDDDSLSVFMDVNVSSKQQVAVTKLKEDGAEDLEFNTNGRRVFDLGVVETTLMDANKHSDGTILGRLAVKDGALESQTKFTLVKIAP